MPSGYQNRISSLSPEIWFKFDETSGTPANSGASSNCAISFTSGSPTANQASTVAGKSYNFDGNDAYKLDTGSLNSNVFADGTFSIEAWVKTSSSTGIQEIFQMGVSTNSNATFDAGWALRMDLGKPQAYYIGKANTTFTQLTHSTTISDNNWHHLVMTVKTTSGNYDLKLYVDGTLSQSDLTNSTTIPGSNADGVAYSWKRIAYSVNNDEYFIGNIDELAIYTGELTSTQITDNYNKRGTSEYTADAATVSNSTLVDPVITAIKNNAYSHTVSTASADSVMPTVSLGINVDGGGVSTGSALIVDPVISVISNIEYTHTASTASATSPDATASATKTVNYSASPATASALLSSNVFASKSEQDTSYSLVMRQIRTGLVNPNTDAANGFSIGTQTHSNGSVIELRQGLILKPNSGFPAYNKLVKARVDGTHVTTAGGDNSPSNTFNIYVLTGDPTSGTFTTAGFDAFTTNREYLYTTRQGDDNLQNYLFDLTPALADSRAATYGIMIEHVVTPTGSSGQIWDRTEYYGNGLDNGRFLYVLASDIANKTINANIMTATGLATDVTVATQKYVNLSVNPSTASALAVQPGIGLGIDVNAMVVTATGLMVQPGFARTVEYPHTHAEAFATPVTPTLYIQGYNNYNAAPATASALFHMPQTSIGEVNTADHMNASAVFVNPLVILNKSVDAMVATVSGLMVQPTTNNQLLGVVFAQPMTAGTIFPNPPAYLNLFGDKWYATLYAQHSVRHGQPAGYGTAFLKIFEDQNTDITQSTPFTPQSQNTFNGEPTLRDLRNNVTWGMAVNSGPENDNRKVIARAITNYSTAANESRLSVGYFDPYSRKAVRFQNIGFDVTSSLGYSKSDFSMEFSIKTTKANQILSYGEWNSPTGLGPGSKTTFNLVDGKLNYFSYGASNILHPKMTKPTSGYTFLSQLTGNKAINDGQWHHIVIQYVEGPEEGNLVGRFQIWIDGELDIQRFNQGSVYDPDVIGANIEDVTYAPDFYTSAWSIDAPATVSERDIDLHYFDYIKYEPIFAAPMTATVTHTNNNIGKGNRPRALMLYWWPTSSGQNKNLTTRKFDSITQSGEEFDYTMSPQELETIDYVSYPPQKYYGWDVFPVDVNGYFVSDLVKEEAYGGAENILLTDLGGAVLAQNESARPQFKINRLGYFRNTLDDTRRYIDLVNDIDLSQFDMIMFKNYPDQSNEIDVFAKNEIVDPYFNIRETKIYQDFIKSLRAAVDTGISLMVNNPQLALDLKIINRIEVVPDLQDSGYFYSDPYTPTIVPGGNAYTVTEGQAASLWQDTFKNNRIRVLNTFSGITDEPCNIRVRAAFYNNDDAIKYGDPSRPFNGYERKQNGLSVGDEFFLSTFKFGPEIYTKSLDGSRKYLATPISNILCGTPITAFANQYRRGLDLVDNPYKNYATSIAIKPGDILDGRQVNGKIWVNFTESINQENEYAVVDAIHTNWINWAYQDGIITLEEKNTYLAQPDLLETKLANGEITQQEYNSEILWQENGKYILTQSTKLEQEAGKNEDGLSQAKYRQTADVTDTKKRLPESTIVNITGQQFFSFTYSRRYPVIVIDVISMNTRGFRWLSERVSELGQNQAHTAMPASATMVQPIVIGEKQVTINAQAMLANATKVPAVGYAGNDRNIVSLPLEATAVMTSHVKLISAAPMTAAAVHRDSVIRTTATDQVIVYILHEDPILYLREDIIK